MVLKFTDKRKTLDPIWNESVEFPMISRSRQVLLVEVYDWDYTHDDELLGVANIDLSNIPALTTTPFSVDLDTQGKVNLRATFFPYIRPPLDAKSAIPIDLGAVSDVGMKAVGGAASLATVQLEVVLGLQVTS